jgi:serum/glucocorticoid-regulated kinase 2
MISQRGVGKEVDVYGMGCVLHEMLLGHPPHFANDIDQLYKNIREGKLKLPATLSEEVRDLLKNLLQR